MPIMAHVGLGPGSLVVIPDDDRHLAFRALDGSDLISWDTEGFIAQDAATGLDSPPREVLRQRFAGLPGSRLTNIDDLEREMFLPLWVRPESKDWRHVLDAMGRIHAMADFHGLDYRELEGTFDLVGVCQGQERTLRVAYLEGLEGNYAQPGGYPRWRMFGMSLVAVDPYAKGAPWTTPIVSLPAPIPFLAVNGPAHPLRLSTQVALGKEMNVATGGNVPSSAIITVGGPATSTVVTSPQGLNVTIGALNTGQVFTLDTGRNVRATLDGIESDAAWGLVSPTSQWEPLPADGASISIAIGGATADSWAQVHGVQQWRGLWGS